MAQDFHTGLVNLALRTDHAVKNHFSNGTIGNLARKLIIVSLSLSSFSVRLIKRCIGIASDLDSKIQSSTAVISPNILLVACLLTISLSGMFICLICPFYMFCKYGDIAEASNTRISNNCLALLEIGKSVLHPLQIVSVDETLDGTCFNFIVNLPNF